MKSYLAAAIQMTSEPDLEKNLAAATDLVELAVRRGAQLVSLPENFSFLGEETEKVREARRDRATNRKVPQNNGSTVSNYDRWWGLSHSRC